MALVSDIAFVEYLRHLFSTHLWNMTYIGFADHHGWCEEIPTFSILSFCEGWVKVITKYVPAQEATGSNVTICLHDTAVLLLVPSRTCPPSLQSQRRSAFSWLNADTIAFTFNNLSRHPYDLCIRDPILSWVNACLALCLNRFIDVKAVVVAFNQKKALVGAFSAGS